MSVASQATDSTEEIQVSPVDRDSFASLLARKDVIAWLLHSSERTVLRMCKDHGMPKSGPNLFAVADVVQWYITHLITKGHGGESKDIAEERKGLVRAQRLRHELEIEQRRGNLIDAEAVGNVLNEMATIYSRHLESLSGRLAARVAGMDSPAEIAELLTRETRAVRAATSATTVEFAAAYPSLSDSSGAAPRKRRRAVTKKESAG